VVNYYRLSGYWRPFKGAGDQFQPGTSFDAVWNRYAFDRRLRLLAIDAIERIEVAVRARLAYEHAHAYGPFEYVNNPACLPKLDAGQLAKFLATVNEEATRSREEFVKHFFAKYGDQHQNLPVWEATEIMAFGTLLTFFTGSPHTVKKTVASQFGVPWGVFRSWLLTLTAVRNICAHHGRLWNRVLGVKPLMPDADHYPDWHVPVPIGNDRLFGVLTLCRHCLRHVAPQSAWPERLSALLSEFPGVPIAAMGFPPDWQDSPLWK
jgi:abortive infection bacteriophage resistance protein